MSYRNPPIIVDRSGDIWAQTIANFGQQVAAGITAYGEARKAEIEATRKNQQAMQSLEVQIREKYTDSAREHYLALKKQGDDTVAEQFKQETARLLDGVGVPGEEGYKMGAIDARVQLQLGRDLTTEQRKEYQKIVDDAKNYQTEMVDGFGKVISGMDYVKGKKATDLGTPGGYIFKGKNNLERFKNQLAYHALNTDSMISPNTIESRKMERGENGENFLTTKTLIPVDEMKSGALSKTLTPQELEGVNIVEQDGKQYYQFDFKKDTNIWDGEFVDDVDKLPDYSKAYNVAQIEDDKGNTTTLYSANVTRVDGKTQSNEDIVNLKDIENNVSLYGEMMANAKAVLQGSPEEIEAFLQFGTNRATLTYDSFIEQTGTDFNSQQKFIADALIQNSIETKFSQYETRKATKADVDKLKESNPKTTIKEGDDIKYKVLKSQEIKEEKPTEAEIKRSLENIAVSKKSKQIYEDIVTSPSSYFKNKKIAGKEILDASIGGATVGAGGEGLVVSLEYKLGTSVVDGQKVIDTDTITYDLSDPVRRRALIDALGEDDKVVAELKEIFEKQGVPSVDVVAETDFSQFIEK